MALCFVQICCWTLLAIGLLLLLILLPASVSTIEYHEFGLLKKKSTGTMLLDKGVYNAGRYFNGPDFTFKKFKADAHILEFNGLSVFSGDKLDSSLDITIIYFLKEDKLVELHNAYEKAYEPVVCEYHQHELGLLLSVSCSWEDCNYVPLVSWFHC